MKYLFFIMLISFGCREPWRPKPEEIETPKVDSINVVDTDSTRLNFVVLNKEKFFFTGVKSESTLIRKVRDTVMLDSLARDAKELKRNVRVYIDQGTNSAEFG